jgi:hypothetical protein
MGSVCVRYTYFIREYALLCAQAGISDKTAIGHILDASDNSQIGMESQLAEAFLDVIANIYPQWVPDFEWISKFNKLSECNTNQSNRLYEASANKLIREASLSSITIKDAYSISSAMVNNPEEMLGLLRRSSVDQMLHPKNAVLLSDILHGRWLNRSAELVPEFSTWVNELVASERFRHCEGRDSKIAYLTGHAASIITFHALCAANIGSSFICDVTNSSSNYFRNLLANEKTVGNVDFKRILIVLSGHGDGRFLIKTFDRVADDNNSGLNKSIDPVEKIKVAACMILTEIAKNEYNKSSTKDNSQTWHEAAKYVKKRSQKSVENLIDTYIAITHAMDPDEMIKAAGEDHQFIKYMLVRKRLPEQYISKLTTKDRKLIISSDMGL